MAGAMAMAPRRARSAAQRVVVIGAGLAGLGCARVLADQGLAVTVLEARNRIGGRAHTSRLWADLPCDLGASWIHGVQGNPLTALARDAGLRRVETSFDAALMLDAQGRDIAPDFSLAETLVRRAQRRASERDSDQSLADAVQALPDWPNLRVDQRRLLAHHLNATMEQEYGGSLTQLSAWYGDASEEFDGEDALLPQGFDRLASHLAPGLDIRLNARVTQLAPGAVTLADGTTLEADDIVCTLPLGVLQTGDVAWSEPLAPARQQAIDRLRMGLLNKVWLRFDRVAWPNDVDWIEWLGPNHGFWAQWVSLTRVLRAPVLLGFNAADAARLVEALDDRATVAAAIEALRAMFGSNFPAPVAAQVTRWSRDPFARGSYSFNAVGSGPADRQALAGTDWGGTLWFAGEATSRRYFGTAHGALMSGRDTGRAIVWG